jgi:LysM repeat protein
MYNRSLVRWARVGTLVPIIIGVLFCNSSLASAVSFGSISIKSGPAIEASPAGSRLKYILSEGEEVHDSVEISNSKAEAVTVFLFPSGYIVKDGKIERVEPTTLQMGDPGYWTTFDKQEIALKPNSSLVVNYTIKVPADADVGEHSGAILIAEKRPGNQTKGGSGMQVSTQLGVRVLVRVPGDVDRTLIVGKVHHVISVSPTRVLRFIFDLTNKGNVLLGPSLDTKIRGIFGRVGEDLGGGTDLLGRGQTVTVSKEWVRRAPYFGRFVANFTFHLGEYEQINKDRTTTMLPDKTVVVRYVFWIIPWLELMYFLVFVVILYLLRSVWLYLVITRRLKVKTKIHRVVTGDTLVKIATKYGVDPSVLAKFNLLRWPYELRIGDELLVPTGQLSQSEWKLEYASLLSKQELLGGVLNHWFAKRNIDRMARHLGRHMVPKSQPVNFATEVVVTDRGDTVETVADFAHTTPATIIKLNHLRPPYRLRAGQELVIPKAKSVKSAKKPKR